MDDKEILALLWERAENAISALSAKFGRRLHQTAMNILANPQDAEEAVNDAYLAAWNSIPPHRPESLGTYLAKLTRRAALKIWRARDAQKRGGAQTEAVLEELSAILPARDDPAQAVEAMELTAALDRFLAALPETERRVFLRRYWYMDPIREISARFGFSQSKVKSMLARTRAKLLTHLEKEGYL